MTTVGGRCAKRSGMASWKHIQAGVVDARRGFPTGEVRHQRGVGGGELPRRHIVGMMENALTYGQVTGLGSREFCVRGSTDPKFPTAWHLG
jgi:hypothetical protein